jgi:hypothetical protein
MKYPSQTQCLDVANSQNCSFIDIDTSLKGNLYLVILPVPLATNTFPTMPLHIEVGCWAKGDLRYQVNYNASLMNTSYTLEQDQPEISINLLDVFSVFDPHCSNISGFFLLKEPNGQQLLELDGVYISCSLVQTVCSNVIVTTATPRKVTFYIEARDYD